MNEERLIQKKMSNNLKVFIHTVIMALILGFISYILFGGLIALILTAFAGILYAASPGIAPSLVMRFYKVRPLSAFDAPVLHRMFRMICSRAGLTRLPELYLIPTDKMAAFSTGNPFKSAVAISTGMLERLSIDEIAGVTAHEISHIRNNDIHSMWFAMVLSRLTEFFAFIGQILLVLYLPLFFFSNVSISWLPVMALLLSPVLSYIVQLSLSRVNEFNADLGSAEILGTPEPLIKALSKIEYGRIGWMRYLLPGRYIKDETSLFSTHPPTSERIRRLQNIRETKPFSYGPFESMVQ